MSRQSIFVRPFIMMCWIIAAGQLAVSCDDGTQIDENPSRASDSKGDAGRTAAGGRGGRGGTNAAAGKGGSGGAGRMASSDQAGKEASPGEDAGAPDRGDEQDGGMEQGASGGGGTGGAPKAGTGGTTAGQGGTGGTGGAATDGTCESCQAQAHDGANFCPTTVAACHGMPGNTSADSPVRPNTPNGALCKEIIECMEAMGCAKKAATDCLCGAGVDPNICFGGSYANMKGPCKELIAAGTETTNATDLALRFSSEEYPMGLAVQVIELCDQLSCLNECL